MSAGTLPALRTRIDPEASDDDLVAATRAGDNRAYGVLWDRHSPAALRAARSITSSIDAEDLVSEAFAKTFSAIRNGGGPTDAFRPYLFAAVRSAAATWGGKQKDVTLEYIDELAVDDSEETLDLLSDKTLLSEAFKELPERWRTLLWYLEVEGMRPREIAPLMGLSPNAVSVLATRAREGFKVAWLNAHIKEPGREAECRWTCERIVAHGRKRHISRSDRARFDAHLELCRRCAMASAEVAQASSKLRAVLLPMILGSPAAAAYSASSPAPASAAAGASVLANPSAPLLIVGVAVVVVTVAAAIGAVAAQLAPVEPPNTERQAPSELVVDDPAPISSPVAVDPSPIPEPPAPIPDLQPHPLPDVEPSFPGETVEQTSPLDVTPSSVPTAPPAEPRTRPESPTEQPPAEQPPAEPPVVEQPPVELPLTLSWSVPASAVVPPPLTGTGTPGARVDIIDRFGRIVGTTLVPADGEFSVSPDADAMYQGMLVTARHTSPVDGDVTVSAAVGPVVFEVPSLSDRSDGVVRRSDADGDGASDDIALELHGLEGSTVSLTIDDDAASSALLSDSSTIASLLDVRLGAHRVTVRYVDPATGAVGPAEEEHIVVIP